MTIFTFISLLACALAEPPVGNGYAAARSSHDYHGLGNQRSLSQEYGVPALGARSNYANDARSQLSYDQAGNAPSQEYGTPGFRSTSQEFGPNTRTGFSQGYGLSNARSSHSQEYKPPNTRLGLSQNFGAPKARSGLSPEYSKLNTRSGPGISQEYGLPNSRSISQQYTSPNLRHSATDYTRSQDYSISGSHLSQEYGTPQLRSSQDYADVPSDSYGTPLQRSSQGLSDYKPSDEYGLPSQRNFDQSPSEKNGQPSFGNSQSYNPSSQGSGRFNKGSTSSRSFQSSFGSRSPSQSFGTPQSSSYLAPSARSIDSYSPAVKSISATYLPSSRSVSQTYGAPEGRRLSTDISAPDARGLNTNAYASSFDTARSFPSTKYDAPATRDAMPSEQYGVPEQYDALSSQGYSYATNALDELVNQEPANYDFGYKVSDYISGSDFGHTESRQENKAEGSYFVVLPDGTKQTVDYEADERGFKPRISVEPAESRTGYDENAADLTRSTDGPY